MRACRKKRLSSENQAHMIAREMAKDGKFVQPYFCAQCKAWHTGTSKGLRKKRLDFLFDKIAAELRGEG